MFFFFFIISRKWLPPPLRKLSQSKVDKTSTDRPPPPPPLPPPSTTTATKKSSGLDKLFKLPSSGDKSQSSVPIQPPTPPILPTSSITRHQMSSEDVDQTQYSDDVKLPEQNGTEDVEDEQFEIPPPMKPITESMLTSGTPNTGAGEEMPTVSFEGEKKK